ncbi:MAG: phosphoribosyltransferase [Thermoanaerobaculia bacterium]
MSDKSTRPPYRDREQGAKLLAAKLHSFQDKPQTLVLGLPRGGVVTAAVVAEELHLPLDVLVVRKLGTPGQPELAMGAIGPGGVLVLNDSVVRSLRITPDQIDRVARSEGTELERREKRFRGDRPPLDVAGKTVIVVDDGLATGATMAAAVAVLRRGRAAKIVVATPVAPLDTCEAFRKEADEVVCVASPEPFLAVGRWYSEFPQVEDDEVVEALHRVEVHAV